MALTNIRLFEALKRDINEDAARMIAEVIPPADHVATTTDLATLEAKVDRIHVDLIDRMSKLEARFGALERRMYGLVLTLLIPVWGALAAAAVKVVIRL